MAKKTKKEKAMRTIDDLKIMYPKYRSVIETAKNTILTMSPPLQKEFLTAMRKVK